MTNEDKKFKEVSKWGYKLIGVKNNKSHFQFAVVKRYSDGKEDFTGRVQITYVPGGTTLITGCQGTLAWKRYEGIEGIDHYFPNERTGIDYWIEKLERHINTWTVPQVFSKNAALESIQIAIDSFIEDLKEEEDKELYSNIQQTIEGFENLMNCLEEKEINSYDDIREEYDEAYDEHQDGHCDQFDLWDYELGSFEEISEDIVRIFCIAQVLNEILYKYNNEGLEIYKLRKDRYMRILNNEEYQELKKTVNSFDDGKNISFPIEINIPFEKDKYVVEEIKERREYISNGVEMVQKHKCSDCWKKFTEDDISNKESGLKECCKQSFLKEKGEL